MPLSPVFPINWDSGTFQSFSNEEVEMLVKQSIKMILLTAPGERIMEPNFGVGLKLFLFNFPTSLLSQKIKSRIKSQISIYLPIITINNIDLSFPDNIVYIKINYSIDSLGVDDFFETEVSI